VASGRQDRRSHRASIRVWSEHELCELIRMRNEGRNFGFIGIKLGIPAHTCWAKYQKVVPGYTQAILDVPKMRKCLMDSCGQIFTSTHKGNRICPRCKGSAAYLDHADDGGSRIPARACR
jgi:hypothetical protein